VTACDEELLNRYLSIAVEGQARRQSRSAFFLHFSDATALQDGVAAARRKLIRIAETRDFISSLKQ
jgi:hypothetical protein